MAPAPRLTAHGLYAITWTTRPDPIPLGELFDIEATVTNAKTGAPVEDAVVRIDARMPQHGHGMATRPEDDLDATNPGGVYVTHGMKFHMPGAWSIVFVVEGPAGTDRLEVDHRL